MSSLSQPNVDAVEKLSRRLDLVAALEPWNDLRFSGSLGAVPTLVLDDFSAIPFLDVPGAEEYQHRARVRAEKGHLYAAVSAPCPGYEDYCRDYLSFGEVELVRASADIGRMAVARSCLLEPTFSHLIDRARSGAGLTLHPYMGFESVWDLAEAVRRESGVPVEVLSPPPPVTWIANDKGLFSDLVAAMLGSDWIVDTRPSADPDELAGHLLSLGKRHSEVALKRLRCASGTGNKVFASERLRSLTPAEVACEVRDFLTHTEWDGAESVLAVAWERSPLSPSTQMWIPPFGQGPPVLEGIYEQILRGEEGTFVGSRPSTLPARVDAALAEGARIVASGLQRLGYVGRCSFDHLVLGDPDGEFAIRFTECNGRWGGTSIPMRLVDRLISGPRPPYRAQDVMSQALTGVPFAEIVREINQHLFNKSTGRGDFVLYNPGPLALVGKIDVIGFGATQQEAEEAVEERLPRILGI